MEVPRPNAFKQFENLGFYVAQKHRLADFRALNCEMFGQDDMGMLHWKTSVTISSFSGQTDRIKMQQLL